MKPRNSSFRYIDQQSAFDDACQQLHEYQHIALDTEFLRERTYYAKLCLLQLFGDSQPLCIDTLKDFDAAPLCALFREKDFLLHAGRQDLEILYQHYGAFPTALFDTQIGAGLCGYAPQIAYAALVLDVTGIALDKSHTRTDWSKRPLSNDVLDYAADDVRYLPPVRDALLEKLDRLNRLGWVEEDSAALSDVNNYQSAPETAWQRVKGLTRLPSQAIPAAMALAAWREAQAEATDRPRQWILKDNVIIALAMQRPRDQNALDSIDGLPAKTARQHGSALLQAIQQPPENDTYRPSRKPTPDQRALARELSAQVAHCADELGVANEIIAPQKELKALSMGSRDVRVLRGWRRALIGDQLMAGL